MRQYMCAHIVVTLEAVNHLDKTSACRAFNLIPEFHVQVLFTV